MDIYLYEGIKTIYRFGIAFIILSSNAVNPVDYKSADSYWNALIKNRTERCPLFFDICNYAHDIGKGFFSRKCVPARVAIGKIEASARVDLASKLGESFKAPLVHKFAKHIEIPNGLSGGPVIPIAHDLHLKSAILDAKMSVLLQSYLPKNVGLEGFELMYATHLDGWNLGTLYNRIEKLSPCLLIIKSVQGAIFGAFLSTEMTPVSTSPKGDGRCFIFRLNGGKPHVYRWSSANSDGVTLASHHMFFVSAHDYLCVGSDNEHGSMAIRLDESMQNCVCGTSDTYDNRISLVPESKELQIAVGDVEVLCGRSSVFRSGKPPHVK